MPSTATPSAQKRNDIGASELNEIILRAGYRALMLAPLLRGEDIVGTLVVRRRTPGEFAKNTVDIIKTFAAAQSALAIQNARLFHEIEDKSRQLAGSAGVSRWCAALILVQRASITAPWWARSSPRNRPMNSVQA